MKYTFIKKKKKRTMQLFYFFAQTFLPKKFSPRLSFPWKFPFIGLKSQILVHNFWELLNLTANTWSVEIKCWRNSLLLSASVFLKIFLIFINKFLNLFLIIFIHFFFFFKGGGKLYCIWDLKLSHYFYFFLSNMHYNK